VFKGDQSKHATHRRKSAHTCTCVASWAHLACTTIDQHDMQCRGSRLHAGAHICMQGLTYACSTSHVHASAHICMHHLTCACSCVASEAPMGPVVPSTQITCNAGALACMHQLPYACISSHVHASAHLGHCRQAFRLAWCVGEVCSFTHKCGNKPGGGVHRMHVSHRLPSQCCNAEQRVADLWAYEASGRMHAMSGSRDAGLHVSKPQAAQCW
jgi:hypothetical protein